MKKKNGFSALAVIVGVLAVAFVGIASFLVIDGNNKATNLDEYDFYSVIEPTKDNGNIGDHVKGSADAPVLIFEYADYQCPGCASLNPHVNKVVKELDGKLGVVYRSYLLSYHQNATAAASAAEAAGLQGYWKEYADKLFEEQEAWEYASDADRTALFNKYFLAVTDNKGDLEKFNNDIKSAEISKKISFDMGIGKRVNVEATPAFYIDGQHIDWTNSNGSSLTVNGQTFKWDHRLSTSEFTDLIKNLVAAKLNEEIKTGDWTAGED